MSGHRIPPITDPMGRHWDQPNRDKITDITESHATMSRTAFLELAEYSCSIPSGVYLGKMWKSRFADGWYLRWYDREDGDQMEIASRRINVTMTDLEFCGLVIEWGREWLLRKVKVKAGRKHR